MAVVGVEREIPPRGNLLRSGKAGAQQVAGAGLLSRTHCPSRGVCCNSILSQIQAEKAMEILTQKMQ